MKLKFWKFEYEFDRSDAEIVVPILLLLLAIFVTDLNPLWLLGSATAYYFLYFFLPGTISYLGRLLEGRKIRCPKCGNKKIILQGYDTYKSDEHYPYYFCDSCKTTSILTPSGMLKI